MINPDTVELLVRSMTQNGTIPLREIEVERFLNALTRLDQGVPTGSSNTFLTHTSSATSNER